MRCSYCSGLMADMVVEGDRTSPPLVALCALNPI